jgi:hypothetical protein
LEEFLESNLAAIALVIDPPTAIQTAAVLIVTVPTQTLAPVVGAAAAPKVKPAWPRLSRLLLQLAPQKLSVPVKTLAHGQVTKASEF